MNGAGEIRRLLPGEYASWVPQLGAILADCVNAGASVSFLLPFTATDGAAFFASLAGGVEQEERIVFGAFVEGKLAGTAQLILNLPPNQPHRAEIAKMLVSPQHRGKGLAAALLAGLEAEAKARGKWLLVMDTVRDGVADRLYRRQGYQVVGIIPDYALMPDGALCDTVVFYKDLRATGT